jgi:hypothetical protein
VSLLDINEALAIDIKTLKIKNKEIPMDVIRFRVALPSGKIIDAML